MYRQISIILLFCGCLTAALAQDEERNKLGFYPTISFQTGFPTGTFKHDFDRKVLVGFTVDGVITPVKKNHFWQPGAQLDFLFTGNKKDTWNGIEVESGGAFFKFNLINRIRPSHTGHIDPFFELAYGINISNTTTNYKVVDEATFWEKFLLDQDDEIVTKQLKSYTDTGSNLAIGIGAFIKNLLVVQLKYNWSPEIGFVTKENMVVENNTVQYKPSKANMQIISLSIGLSFR